MQVVIEDRWLPPDDSRSGAGKRSEYMRGGGWEARTRQAPTRVRVARRHPGHRCSSRSAALTCLLDSPIFLQRSQCHAVGKREAYTDCVASSLVFFDYCRPRMATIKVATIPKRCGIKSCFQRLGGE